MAKIPAAAWIVIGAFISVLSWVVKSKADNTGMLLFFYLGIGFITIGVLKLIFNTLKPEEKPKPAIHNNKMLHQHTQSQMTAAAQQPARHPQQLSTHRQQHPQQARHPAGQPTYHPQAQQHYRVCFGCGTKHPLHDTFCNRCGARLR